MSSDNRALPLYWNSIDGRFVVFYRNYQNNMSDYILTTFDGIKAIEYLENSDTFKPGYRRAEKKGLLIDYIKDNVEYNLQKIDSVLGSVWKLKAWILPSLYDKIEINEPMRKRINIHDYKRILYKKTHHYKFKYFKQICKKNNKSIYNLPFGINNIIEKYLVDYT